MSLEDIKKTTVHEESESELAKSNFLARMSHEMRTPLNAIIGMSTIAQASADAEKVAECLVKINEASVHLLGMINDILDMAKIEVGSMKLTCAEFNLPQMLQKTAEAKKFALDAKKQILELDIDPGLPENIVSDEQRFAKVLDNLLSNAVKFTPPEGTITLSVKNLKEDEKTCTLGIKVIDSGIGISGEALKTVFSLFEQADGGMARKYEGTGLGLPISASIVRLMGGQIQVKSEPGKGAEFGFDITVETGKKKTLQDPSSQASAGPDEKPKYEGLSFLVAEDVEINREIILALFEDTGVTIDCAKNGLQAFEMYKAGVSKYNLVLMDIHMPEMDGYEATRQIRAHEKEHSDREQIPIIAMTANVFKEDVEKCLAAGMTSHLGKPIDFELLMQEIDKQLPKG